MPKLSFLCFIVLAPHLVGAQGGFAHGTVVVTNISEDKLVIAADSLAIRGFRDRSYSSCKISVFGHQVIFSGINNQSYFNAGFADPVASWDAREILRQIVKSEPNGSAGFSHIRSIAIKWASALGEKFQAYYLRHPIDVAKLAAKDKVILTGGIFAEAVNGTIYFRVAVVTLNPNLFGSIEWAVSDKIDDCWTCGQIDGSKICAGGQTAIAAQFCAQSSDRLKAEEEKLTYRSGQLDSGWDSSSLLTLRIAELTAANDTSGLVGGKIDVLELKKDGNIRWLAKKDECLDNQD